MKHPLYLHKIIKNPSVLLDFTTLETPIIGDFATPDWGLGASENLGMMLHWFLICPLDSTMVTKQHLSLRNLLRKSADVSLCFNSTYIRHDV